MECEFDYCIYNRECTCTLDKIQINFLGACGSLEIITIPQENIEKYKKKRLKEINSLK